MKRLLIAGVVALTCLALGTVAGDRPAPQETNIFDRPIPEIDALRAAFKRLAAAFDDFQ